jgi:hypothetical protein
MLAYRLFLPGRFYNAPLAFNLFFFGSGIIQPCGGPSLYDRFFYLWVEVKGDDTCIANPKSTFL